MIHAVHGYRTENYTYVHTPFTALDHQAEDMKVFVSKANAIANMGKNALRLRDVSFTCPFQEMKQKPFLAVRNFWISVGTKNNSCLLVIKLVPVDL
eukprot:UN23920